MKKSLIALAALAATGAFAQSSVSLYGRADVGYSSATVTDAAGADTKVAGVNSHNSVSSFWGITGSEDLGGGMKANFKFEADLFPATGNEGVTGSAGGNGALAQFNRKSTVGLSGGFGTLNIGRDYTPMFNVIAATDIFALSRLSTVNLAGNVGSTVDRQIMYTTPSFSGVTVNLSMGSNENIAAAGTKTQNTNASVVYANGPIYAALATGYSDTNSARTVDGSAVGLAYDFGKAKAMLNHITQKTAATGVEKTETNLGLNVPMGKMAVQAAYGRNTSTAAQGDGNDWGLGLSYELSKRTTAFAKTGVYNKTGDNAKTTETNVGVRHVF